VSLLRKFVMIVPDGAADSNRELGCSPLQAAKIPNMDFTAREGVCGLAQTLYSNLPRESMVAQLGMLGWDPRLYYPCGRASAELLASDAMYLSDGDIAFRANLVRMAGERLESYNADFIDSRAAQPLVILVQASLAKEFPEFDLRHNSDFRNTLILRDAGVDPSELICPEPHENHGRCFELNKLIGAKGNAAQKVADRINAYLLAAARVLQCQSANALFPWSASGPFRLPPFQESTGFHGRAGVVGYMDFLLGIAKAAGMDFFRVGNGRPNTDYQAKGGQVISLLRADYSFVVCHINGPDEASHMSDLTGKIASLESIDKFIVGPIIRYFQENADELGGVMVLPDHYSNIASGPVGKRADIHSIQPVPFTVWNNRDRDSSREFNEDAVVGGKYGSVPVSHLSVLPLLINSQKSRRTTA
jgi:2,3-bisphosphoglycerate-independent phosphoglycerate mutase